jgi:hypothetical protein
MIQKVNLNNENQIQNIEKSTKDQFYLKQIQERDTVLEELRMALEVAEMKIKKSEDDKVTLNNKLKDYTERAKQAGLLI